MDWFVIIQPNSSTVVPGWNSIYISTPDWHMWPHGCPHWSQSAPGAELEPKPVRTQMLGKSKGVQILIWASSQHTKFEQDVPKGYEWSCQVLQPISDLWKWTKLLCRPLAQMDKASHRSLYVKMMSGSGVTTQKKTNMSCCTLLL